MQAFRAEVEQRFRELRDRIVAGLEQLEGSGATFRRTGWERPGGGGGELSELRGELFQKAGCNFSAGHGDRFPPPPPGAIPEARGAGGRPPRVRVLAAEPICAVRASSGPHPKTSLVP